ncbi:MAG TPA: SPFH domain-containing protein [Pyrinomonadaceae bacterium]|nr:SPFH domain-containing protein [Pyrinomonadaceae bacterium]
MNRKKWLYKHMSKQNKWPDVVGADTNKGESMSGSKYFIAGVVLLIIVAIVGASVAFANIDYAQEGTVKVVTKWGAIERVYRPADGWFTTVAPGRKSYEVNIKSFTESATARVTSRDNAALQVEIAVTAYTDPEKITEYVRKYGFTEDDRHKRREQIIHGLVQTEARNAFADFGAYEIYANQEQIQKRIVESLRPQLANQLLLVTESVQIGNPDFLDDRIEAAASGVVANEKQKQAEEARLEAAKIAAQTKQIEAQTYANPALLDIKKLELQLEIERARADGIKNHNGALTILYGTQSGMNLQLPAGR